MLSPKPLRTAFVFLCLLLPSATGQAQWPQFGGANRDFHSIQSPEVESFKFNDWSIELGPGDAAPIVDGNRIFVTEAAYTEDGQEAMHVHCLDPSDGSSLWKTLVEDRSYMSQDISDSYPVRPLASPVAAAQRIVVVSYGGCVSCLDQQTGRLHWQHDLVSEFNATPMQYGWATSPWSDGTSVVVACGGSQALAMAFHLDTGKVIWMTSPGEAAYGSFSEVVMEDGSKHLCYVGRDALFGFDPKNGETLWNYPLPEPGLTNAVTPISLPRGQLLVAGQGFASSRLLQVQNANGSWSVRDVWTTKSAPFYCNWVVDTPTQQVFAYNSKVLGVIDLATGNLNWRTRGWTDANFAIHADAIVGIRGDGFLAKSRITQQGMNVMAGARVVNDRVWAPPVLVGQAAFIRGRKSLSAVNLDQLPAIDKLPNGTNIDSMSAMYGEKHENVVALLEKASTHPDDLQYAEYESVVNDRSVRFGEGDYRAILGSLEKCQDRHVSIRIAQHWCQLEPDSIVAFDKLVELLRLQGDNDRADQLVAERLIDVEIAACVPESTAPEAQVYLAGNASAVQAWKADGVLLTRDDDGVYRAKLRVPQGKFEFKITQGDWESCEVRTDGRSTSNRSRRIVQPTSIQVQVQAWKNDSQR